MDRRTEHVRARIRDLAGPSWNDLLWKAEAALDDSTGRRRADGRVRQFNVTIADRPQLDALSETLDLPRSKVINLALSLLAGKHELHANWYRQFAAEVGEELFWHLVHQAEMPPAKAQQVAADVWQGTFPQFRHVQARLRDGYSCAEVEQDVWDLFDVTKERAQPLSQRDSEAEVWQRIAEIYHKLGNGLDRRADENAWHWTSR